MISQADEYYVQSGGTDYIQSELIMQRTVSTKHDGYGLQDFKELFALN